MINDYLSNENWHLEMKETILLSFKKYYNEKPLNLIEF